MCITDLVVVFSSDSPHYVVPHPSLLSFLCTFGVGEACILFHFSQALAFNFYHGVELYSKAQISAVQQLFGENWCASFVDLLWGDVQNLMRNLYGLLLISNLSCMYLYLCVCFLMLGQILTPVLNAHIWVPINHKCTIAMGMQGEA